MTLQHQHKHKEPIWMHCIEPTVMFYYIHFTILCVKENLHVCLSVRHFEATRLVGDSRRDLKLLRNLSLALTEIRRWIILVYEPTFSELKTFSVYASWMFGFDHVWIDRNGEPLRKIAREWYYTQRTDSSILPNMGWPNETTVLSDV